MGADLGVLTFLLTLCGRIDSGTGQSALGGLVAAERGGEQRGRLRDEADLGQRA